MENKKDKKEKDKKTNELAKCVNALCVDNQDGHVCKTNAYKCDKRIQ